MKRGYTMINKNSVAFEWTINNMDAYLSLINESDEYPLVTSPEFSIGIENEVKWQLELVFLNSLKTSDSDTIHLVLSNSSNVRFNIKYSVYISDAKREKKMMITVHEYFVRSGIVLTLSEKSLLANIDEYLPNNILTVGLDLSTYDDPSNSSTDTSLCIKSKRLMTQDYRELYNSKIESDVTINVRGKEFKAHKAFLIARSPVLAAMFLHEMIEKKTNEIDMNDLTQTTFEKMLEYIYTDEVTNLDAHAEDLLKAANKYQIQPLKDICQESISKTLTEANALEILVLADLYKANNLFKFTTNFILLNSNNIVEGQKFLDFKEENSVLAIDLLKNFKLSRREDRLSEVSTSPDGIASGSGASVF